MFPVTHQVSLTKLNRPGIASWKNIKKTVAVSFMSSFCKQNFITEFKPSVLLGPNKLILNKAGRTGMVVVTFYRKYFQNLKNK